jgi:D-lactate dehydrogenase
MKIAFFDTHDYEREAFDTANAALRHKIGYFEPRLTAASAPLAKGHAAVCSFVNDRVDAATLAVLAESGVRLVLLRCAGYNHVDLEAARRLQLPVSRVPEYSPHAVAEHTVALLLALNRRIHRAHARIHDLNFSLEGLVGFDLHGKSVGVIGTGKIGALFARIMRGFGCRILAYDKFPNRELLAEPGVESVTLERLYAESDVISLHVPLLPETHHLLDQQAFRAMKRGAIVLNTGRGKLIETRALVAALKSRRLGGAALDVYEEEEGVFFHDHSDRGIDDDQLARLLTFPNVLITSHQAFLTREALHNIAVTTLESASAFDAGLPLQHLV